MKLVAAPETGLYRFDTREVPAGIRHGISAGESLAIIALEHGHARICNDGVSWELHERECGLYLSKEALEISCAGGHAARISSCSVARSASVVASEVTLLRSGVCSQVSDQIATLFRLGLDAPCDDRAKQSRLRDIIGEALLQSAVAEYDTNAYDDVPPLLRRTISFLNDSVTQECNLDLVASAVGVRKERLITAFRKQFGITPIRYLWDLRTRHGMHLLRTSRLTLAEIAAASGYKSHFHLSREVKRVTGLSPREYRQQPLRTREAAWIHDDIDGGDIVAT